MMKNSSSKGAVNWCWPAGSHERMWMCDMTRKETLSALVRHMDAGISSLEKLKGMVFAPQGPTYELNCKLADNIVAKGG